ncbi:hypothetical protein TNIN_161721 [Trichonephila inaurata madagascariensis]|uniref:non-specific serine/threonine protein kinase n=1 Tax=Trichonephila inaurata madagascariensis TaxID=2747483 RepID=A0A8X6XH86_9ARAC|nr:hypothetical protein TNIN_161721 [Trichonephila inaurata madagascariensis]
MKRIKCYGRAKTNLVDTSFKRKFFGQNSVASPGCSNFQDYHEKTIEFNTSNSDEENTDKFRSQPYKLFASINDISDSNSSSSTGYQSTANQRKSLRFLYRNKSYAVKQKSIQFSRPRLLKRNFPIEKKIIAVEAQPAVNSSPKLRGRKRKMQCRKLTGASKARRLRSTCKVASLYSQLETTSELQPKLLRKNNSKYVKYSRSYNLRIKKKINTSKHSPIAVQPSCAAMCQYSLRDKKIVNKKKNRKRQNKDHCSKSDSFWAAMQPNWSSICDYSLEVEKNTEMNKANINTDVCKKSKDIFENIKKSQPYFPPVTSEKSKTFYSSTPICSPVSHSHFLKISHFAKLSTPVTEAFITSTPSQKFKQTKNKFIHINNISKISAVEHRGNEASVDFSSKPTRLPSSNRNSLLLRKSRTLYTTHQSSMQRRHPSVRSLSKSRASSKEVIHLSSSNLSASDFQSTLFKLLDFCGQTSIIPFKEIYDWRHTTIRKIGEGSYGEVYSIVQNKVSECLSTLRNNKNNKTKNFGKLKSVHIVKGEYPAEMLVAWEKFSVAKTTYNSKPDIFDDQQLFTIIELEYGGKDMTSFVLRNAAEAESVLKQIAISLAIAEEAHLFEHRDLHLGNILVQRNASKSISYVLRGQPFSIPNQGLIVTIIDFTLSRVLDDGCIFYNDLADDESLFNQSGDFQFEIYRAIQLHLNNEWHKSLLYSNVLWLTFLCKKLLEYEYSRPSSKKHQIALKNIKVFESNLQPCKSALESLTACSIVTSIPDRDKDSLSFLNAKTKLIDRKSLQKIHFTKS